MKNLFCLCFPNFRAVINNLSWLSVLLAVLTAECCDRDVCSQTLGSHVIYEDNQYCFKMRIERNSSGSILQRVLCFLCAYLSVYKCAYTAYLSVYQHASIF